MASSIGQNHKRQLDVALVNDCVKPSKVTVSSLVSESLNADNPENKRTGTATHKTDLPPRFQDGGTSYSDRKEHIGLCHKRPQMRVFEPPARELAPPVCRIPYTNQQFYTQNIFNPGNFAPPHQPNILFAAPMLPMNCQILSPAAKRAKFSQVIAYDHEPHAVQGAAHGRERRISNRPLPTQARKALFAWLHSNLEHPYPNDVEKTQLANSTGLSVVQVSNWFNNARRRKLHQTLQQERKEEQSAKNGT